MSKTERDAKRWQALMKHASIEHTEDSDMEPVFEVRLPVIWTAADKGFRAAVDAMIKEQEDA